MRTIKLSKLDFEINQNFKNNNHLLQVNVTGKTDAISLPFENLIAQNKSEQNFYNAWLVWRQNARLDPEDDFSDVFNVVRN